MCTYVQVKRIREMLKQVDKPDGLYGNYMNPRTGAWGMSKYILHGLTLFYDKI